MKPIKKTIPFGRHTVTLETGEIARQADGAVLVTWTTPSCWSPASRAQEAKAGQDFFPLTVDYQEKTYAAGKIPGGFFKREGRPSEKEIADLAASSTGRCARSSRTASTTKCR